MRLIDADAFLKIAKEELWMYDTTDLDKMISYAPTVDKWIPCKERLPDKQGEYLTFIESEGKTCYDISMYDCYSWNYTENCSVLAWMPLPEPYNETKCLGYDNENCPNCGRLRVEKYSNGDKICEKCNWNITKQEYDLRRL